MNSIDIVAPQKTATKVKSLTGYTGDAALYKLNPPLELRDWADNKTAETEYVIVSATFAMFSGPETYIFPAADETSEKPSDWGELDGSYRGGLDHEEALRGAGYEVVS